MSTYDQDFSLYREIIRGDFYDVDPDQIVVDSEMGENIIRFKYSCYGTSFSYSEKK